MKPLSYPQVLLLAVFLVIASFVITAAERDPGKSISGLAPIEETITVDAAAQAHAFPHFSEKTLLNRRKGSKDAKGWRSEA